MRVVDTVDLLSSTTRIVLVDSRVVERIGRPYGLVVLHALVLVHVVFLSIVVQLRLVLPMVVLG